MKPSDLPFGGYENEKLRILMAEAISRAEISVGNNGGEPTEHANSLKKLFDAGYLYLEPITGKPEPIGIDDSTLTVFGSDVYFTSSWGLPVKDPKAIPLDGWKINVRLGGPSGTIVYTTTIAPDISIYSYDGPDLTPATNYFFTIQGVFTNGGQQYGTGLAGKPFTTAAA